MHGNSDEENIHFLEPLAIIGMSCRFPGARNVDAFWQNLKDGSESISFFSEEELAEAGVAPALLKDPRYVRAQAVLEDIDLFDAPFFGFSPREAEMMDPQHRIFLECAWEALESAGYDSSRCSERTGVYAGSGLNTYLLKNLVLHPELLGPDNEYTILISNDKDYMPARVSYKLNLRGPSININTACSTSLVVIHLACQGLLSYQCDMALAGGVTIQVPQKAGYLYEEGGPQSPDGHCRAFDADAKGMVGGSGVGIVVLKRLEDALADGDCVHAVIRGSAVNNDGSYKVGFTAPSVDGQAEVIAEAQAVAGIGPETITYIEAHGTGTALGDPIEIAGLTKAFRAGTGKKGFCAIGSVKTNIGHLDTAAGIAGLIKTVLCLKHGQIPASLHFRRANPQIDFVSSPFYVNTALRKWETGAIPRRAGVSSFGMGGTNAHVVLEQAPEQAPGKASSRPFQLLPVSAKTETALDKATANLAAHLRKHPDTVLADAAFTLSCGRRAFGHRRAAICGQVEEAARALECLDPQRVLSGTVEHKDRPVVFMFPGQGSQYVNMGLELYQVEGVFREQVDVCAQTLKPLLGFDLRTVLYPSLGQGKEDGGVRLRQTAVAQPALFVFEYALSRLWMSWGVHPVAMVGHSIGEYVAATLAGVFSLEDALGLAAARGGMMQQMGGGAMLDSSHAFHSGMMGPIVEGFRDKVKGVELNPPRTPYISNVTGTWITAKEATDPGYWSRHLRETVRFFDGLKVLFEEPGRVFLEVGPGSTLSGLAMGHPDCGQDHVVLQSVGHPKDRRSDGAFMVTTLCRLWLSGVEVDWQGFYADQGRRRVPLPTYPFERRRYWVDSRDKAGGDKGAVGGKKPDVADWFYVPSWQRSLGPEGGGEEEGAGRSRWLLFMDGCGLGLGLGAKLSEKGHEVIAVSPGTGFAQVADDEYEINPACRKDYDDLLDALCLEDRVPQNIVHLWSVTAEPYKGPLIERIHGAQGPGYYSLLYLAQAIGERLPAKGFHLSVLSNHIQEVTGEETLCPEKATVLGPVKVIPLEYPAIACRNIDMEMPREGPALMGELMERLYAELTSEPSDPVTAYRGSHRWVQTFEPVRLGDAAREKTRLRERGVYLITGGLGGIGLMLAEYLARTVRAKLVLLGRSSFPQKEEWEQPLLPHGDWEHSIPPVATVRTRTDNGLGVDMAMETAFIHEKERETTDALNIRGVQDYPGFTETVNRLCSLYVYRYFRSNNIELEKCRKYNKGDLRQKLNILIKFEKFFDFFIRILCEDKLIALENDIVRCLVDPTEVEDPKPLKQSLDKRYPQFSPMFGLMEHCVAHYREALSGEMEAISVLYPEGDSSLLEDTVNRTVEHTQHRVYTVLLCDIIEEILRKTPDRTLRILEVGAGAGGFTKMVVPRLINHDVEYFCTDIGKSFVLELEREAERSGFDFMKFGVLDVSKDPEEQGFAQGPFHMIIGLDVIHATRSIEESIGHLTKLLVPDGIIFLIESVRTQRWSTMVYGLAEGWWYFQDGHIRKHSPLLDLCAWEDVFRKQGFKNVTSYPLEEEKRSGADCGLIVAQLMREPEVHERPYGMIRGSGQEQLRDKIRKLKQLETLGSEVLVLRADVSDLEQMRSCVEKAHERFGRIHGVIHAAAIENRGPIQLKCPDSKEGEFSAKMIGTGILDLLFEEEILDFMVLCSSISSISPGIGDVEYCASNAFLDIFAHYRDSKGGKKTLSIDWDRWEGVGMAAAFEAMHRMRTGVHPVGGMRPEEGVEAFRRVLSRGLGPQVIVSTSDFKVRIRESDDDFFARRETGWGDGQRHPRPELGSTYVSPGNDMERTIADIWKQVLGVREVGLHDNFFDLGGDSLILIKVVSRIHEALKVELAVRDIFEKPTVAGLADRIETLRWAKGGWPAGPAKEDEDQGTL